MRSQLNRIGRFPHATLARITCGSHNSLTTNVARDFATFPHTHIGKTRCMNKKALTETDIRSKFITPALCGPGGAGWDLMTQVREEAYFTKGRVIVRGKTVKRGEAKKADYLLFYKPNLPLAVIEAKDNNHSVSAGLQQALDYAATLDIPFAYSSNGDGFIEHDRTVTSGPVTHELALDQFTAAVAELTAAA